MKFNTTVSFLALVAPVLAASIGSQEVLLTLTHVSGDTTSALDSNCFSAVDHAVKNAFQTVHKNSDFSIAGLEFTTEVDAANYDDDDADDDLEADSDDDASPFGGSVDGGDKNGERATTRRWHRMPSPLRWRGMRHDTNVSTATEVAGNDGWDNNDLEDDSDDEQ